MANITYRCPVCGAEINWNAEHNCFACEYCDGEFSVDEIKKINNDSLDGTNVQHAIEIDDDEQKILVSDDGTEGTKLVKYRCPNCQAEMITDSTTAASLCVYCGNPIVITEQVIGDFAPKYVIPFEKTQKEAMDCFLNYMNKPLTPKNFKSSVTIDKVQGIYIPFWLFDGDCSAFATYESLKCIKETVISKSNDDDSYIERKWRVYDSSRKGKVHFSHVPADGSSKTDDEAMQSIEPYNYEKLIEFNPAFLSGYLAERFDEDSEQQKIKIQKRIENSTHDELIKDVDFDRVSTKSFNASVEFKSADYALLPTWLLYCTYNKKKYLFAMNGQTGKFIGNLPIDWGKAALIAGALFIISAILFWFVF